MSAVRAAAVALALTASSARAEGSQLRPWTRGETPALAGRDLAGREIELGNLRGRVVLVQFWASWCEPCAPELAALSKLRERLRSRPFDVVTVNYGEGEVRAEQFIREHALALPVLLDRDQRTARAWGVGGLPMSFLVDARGRVQLSVFGECDWSEGEPAAALSRLLAEAERASGAQPLPGSEPAPAR